MLRKYNYKTLSFSSYVILYFSSPKCFRWHFRKCCVLHPEENNLISSHIINLSCKPINTRTQTQLTYILARTILCYSDPYEGELLRLRFLVGVSQAGYLHFITLCCLFIAVIYRCFLFYFSRSQSPLSGLTFLGLSALSIENRN